MVRTFYTKDGQVNHPTIIGRSGEVDSIDAETSAPIDTLATPTNHLAACMGMVQQRPCALRNGVPGTQGTYRSSTLDTSTQLFRWSWYTSLSGKRFVGTAISAAGSALFVADVETRSPRCVTPKTSANTIEVVATKRVTGESSLSSTVDVLGHSNQSRCTICANNTTKRHATKPRRIRKYTNHADPSSDKNCH